MPEPGGPYPNKVLSEDDRRRWDHSERIARTLFSGLGEEQILPAAHAIYASDFPTDAPADAVPTDAAD